MDFTNADDSIEVDDGLELTGNFTLSINLRPENLGADKGIKEL